MPLSDIFKRSIRRDQSKKASPSSDGTVDSKNSKSKCPPPKYKCADNAVASEVEPSDIQATSVKDGSSVPTSGRESVSILTEAKETSQSGDQDLADSNHCENVQDDKKVKAEIALDGQAEQDANAPLGLTEGIQESLTVKAEIAQPEAVQHDAPVEVLEDAHESRIVRAEIAQPDSVQHADVPLEVLEDAHESQIVRAEIAQADSVQHADVPLEILEDAHESQIVRAEIAQPDSVQVADVPLADVQESQPHHYDLDGTSDVNLGTNKTGESLASEEAEAGVPFNEETAVDTESPKPEKSCSNVTREDAAITDVDGDDVHDAPETIRRLSDFIDETLETEIQNAAAMEHSIPAEVSETIAKLCSFVEVTLEAEMWNVAHSKTSKSVDTKRPPALEIGTISEESLPKEIPDNTYDTEHIYEELPDSNDNTLTVENSDLDQSDAKSVNLLLDEDTVSTLPETHENIDILTPPEEDSVNDSVPKTNKVPPNIEKLDTVSIAGSMYSEQEDQGVYLPMPEFPDQGNAKNHNWKVGYLRVKLPHKSRGRGKLKVWQKRLVVIQPDEFFDDQKNRSLILSIYQSDSTTSRSHNAAFWKSVCSKSAVIYRSSSRTHPYSFTVADDQAPIVHLASDSETESQEWMAAMRNVLWPPSNVMQLEKVLNGNEFEVSVVDNDFAYRAGMLGTYGYLAVTGRKLILCHPQSGHVIQEWYLNTVDKFQLLPMAKEVDAKKVLVMHTSSESSTGCGEIKFFCTEAVAFLQSLASTIHQVLQHHSKEKKGCYEKELEEISHWLAPSAPTPTTERKTDDMEEDHYKVPPRQVRSLLDIPNFIFDKNLYTTSLNGSPPNHSGSPLSKLKTSTTCVSTFSEDSGISVAPSSEDFLNCSHTSFTIGNRSLRMQDRASSSSDLSDAAYTPPITPDVKRKVITIEKPELSVPK